MKNMAKMWNTKIDIFSPKTNANFVYCCVCTFSPCTNFCLPVFFTKTLQTPGLVVLCLLNVGRAHTLQRGRIKDAEIISAWRNSNSVLCVLCWGVRKVYWRVWLNPSFMFNRLFLLCKFMDFIWMEVLSRAVALILPTSWIFIWLTDESVMSFCS